MPGRAWTPRIAVQLAVLASAAFVYVTAEMVPVGALPDIASDLRVSEALVGTLLASYALVAAVTTVPLVRLTAHWPRRRTLMLTLVCLTASQLISALAPDFAVLAGGRVLCAVTHGLMWSVIAPIGARLVPASHTGRATTAVYVGTTLALVVGNPASTALSPMLQAAAMHTAPNDPDGASGVYVTAFQIGIMAGSLAGGLLYEQAGLWAMIASSTVLVLVALGGGLATRGLFVVRSGNQQEVTFDTL